MKKNRINVRGLIDRHQEICDRIGQIADLCERENRVRNDAEETEYRSLTGEDQLLQMKLASVQNPEFRQMPAEDADQLLREAMLAKRRDFTIALQREVITTDGLTDTGILPVQQEEMLKPLRAGLIWEKLGIRIRTGLRGTTLRWPRYGKASARWAKEGERAADSVIQFDKLDAKPERLTVAIPVSRETLDGSDGVVESVIREEIPAAIRSAINEMLFTTKDTYTAADGSEKPRAIYGPLVKAAENPVLFAGEAPTRDELLRMKALVYGSGIDIQAPCWVMTENMKALVEGVKVDVGSGRFLCEDDKILGIPVFTTADIDEGAVAFGDWSCQAGGFFGDMTITADPYTLLRQNSTDFVSNPSFATATLYEEAFVLGRVRTEDDEDEDDDTTGKSESNG